MPLVSGKSPGLESDWERVRPRRLRCLLGTIGGALGGAVLGVQAGAGFTEILLPQGSTLSRLLVTLALAVLGGLGGAASGAVLSCFEEED
jgi:hypothetical protein